MFAVRGKAQKANKPFWKAKVFAFLNIFACKNIRAFSRGEAARDSRFAASIFMLLVYPPATLVKQISQIF